mmetsp:Transcript_16614/g.33130  ORF Transcript_16614/g.33130 Transcript_16614/m.33130 type:complete len:204 (-) Transcript_16614:693-1304(-)
MACTAHPKSLSLTSPSPPTSRFSGLMSLCMKPFSWQWVMASQRFARRNCASSFFRMSWSIMYDMRSPPITTSERKYTEESSWYVPRSLMMNGQLVMACRAFFSSMTLCWCSLSTIDCLDMRFMAKDSPGLLVAVTRVTCPNVPWPRTLWVVISARATSAGTQVACSCSSERDDISLLKLSMDTSMDDMAMVAWMRRNGILERE